MSSKLARTPTTSEPVVLDESGVDSKTEVQADGSATPTADSSLTLTDILTVISNRRRRFILHYLQQAGPAATIGELSTQIAAWEQGKPVERVSSAERKNVYNALAQTHFRRLREHGFIHKERGEVKLTNEAQSIRIHLDIVPDKDVRWSQYYLGLGAFGLVVSTAALFFAPAIVPVGGLGIFVAVSVLVSAAAHWYYKQRMCLGAGELPPELRYDQ